MRQSAMKRQTGTQVSRMDTRALAGRYSRQQASAARRFPLAAPPPISYQDMVMAEAQALRQRAGAQAGQRFQGGSAKEIKSFDCLVTAPAAGINWAMGAAAFAEPGIPFTGMTELNVIAAGAAVYERIGAKIMIRSIRIRTGWTGAATPCLGIVRVAVVYDRQPNGAAPAIGDLFQDLRTAGATTTDLMSGVNIGNKNRFTILRDQSFIFDTTHLTTALDWFIPCRLQTEYRASAGTIGDISTGAVFLVMAAQNTTSFVNMPTCRARIRYED